MDDDEEEREFSKSIVFGFFEQAEQTFEEMGEALFVFPFSIWSLIPQNFPLLKTSQLPPYPAPLHPTPPSLTPEIEMVKINTEEATQANPPKR